MAKRYSWLVLVAIGAASSTPRVARADPEAAMDAPASDASTTSSSRWELAALGGYLTAPIRGGTTPFGAGFGGRIGVDLSHVYVGARVVGYLGGTDVDVTDRSVLYGGTLGYGFVLGHPGDLTLTLRPAMGLGGLTIFHTDPSSVTSGTTTTSSRGRGRSSGTDVVSSASGQGGASDTTYVTTFYVEPEASLLVSGSSVFAGITADMLVVPSIGYSGAAAATWLSYGAQAELGLRF